MIDYDEVNSRSLTNKQQEDYEQFIVDIRPWSVNTDDIVAQEGLKAFKNRKGLRK